MPDTTETTQALKKKSNPLCMISFILSIVIPILIGLYGAGFASLGIVLLSVLGIVKFNSETQKGLWMGIVGLILSSITLFVFIVFTLLGLSLFESII